MKNIFLWMAGGTILTIGAFFIPEQTGSMWPSLILSGSVAFLYLGIFSVVWIRKIESQTKRRVIGSVIAIFLVFSIASAALSYVGSQRQKKTLADIHTSIESSLAETYVKEPLVKTLGSYYASPPDGDIGKRFKSKYDSLISDDHIFKYVKKDSWRTLHVYVADIEPDSVVLIGESSYIKGKDDVFSNFSGAKGRYQVKGILTSKGVDYEREN